MTFKQSWQFIFSRRFVLRSYLSSFLQALIQIPHQSLHKVPALLFRLRSPPLTPSFPTLFLPPHHSRSISLGPYFCLSPFLTLTSSVVWRILQKWPAEVWIAGRHGYSAHPEAGWEHFFFFCTLSFSPLAVWLPMIKFNNPPFFHKQILDSPQRVAITTVLSSEIDFYAESSCKPTSAKFFLFFPQFNHK